MGIQPDNAFRINERREILNTAVSSKHAEKLDSGLSEERAHTSDGPLPQMVAQQRERLRNLANETCLLHWPSCEKNAHGMWVRPTDSINEKEG